MNTPPMPVRFLRIAAWTTLALSVVAFGIGAILGFEELAKIWAVVGAILVLTAAAAFMGTRPSIGGLIAGLVACTLLLLIPPFGTVATIVIGLVASQTWPQVREYYGVKRRVA